METIINEIKSNENDDVNNQVLKVLLSQATSNNTIPENKRNDVWRFYKMLKYKKDYSEFLEEKKENKVVDPVDDYVLKKKYTNNAIALGGNSIKRKIIDSITKQKEKNARILNKMEEGEQKTEKIVISLYGENENKDLNLSDDDSEKSNEEFVFKTPEKLNDHYLKNLSNSSNGHETPVKNESKLGKRKLSNEFAKLEEEIAHPNKQLRGDVYPEIVKFADQIEKHKLEHEKENQRKNSIETPNSETKSPKTVNITEDQQKETNTNDSENKNNSETKKKLKTIIIDEDETHKGKSKLEKKTNKFAPQLDNYSDESINEEEENEDDENDEEELEDEDNLDYFDEEDDLVKQRLTKMILSKISQGRYDLYNNEDLEDYLLDEDGEFEECEFDWADSGLFMAPKLAFEEEVEIPDQTNDQLNKELKLAYDQSKKNLTINSNISFLKKKKKGNPMSDLKSNKKKAQDETNASASSSAQKRKVNFKIGQNNLNRKNILIFRI
jgi:hypothetical protein